MNVETILAWIDNPVVKYALVLIGGFILKRWPAFPNKAIPIATGVASIILSILGAMWPATPTIAPAIAMVGGVALTGAVAVNASIFDGLLMSILMNGIVPWLMAIGTHSAVKNSAEGIRK